MPNKKKKGFRRSPGTATHKTKSQVQRQPRRRKQWTNEMMKAALHSVLQEGLSGNKAADIHGVPRKDRLSGRVKHGTKPGPKPYLTNEEEAQLSSYLFAASQAGFGKTRRDVKCLVETYISKERDLKGPISDGWWRRFLERNPTLSLRSGDSTAGVRMDAINSENMDAYFNLLREVFDKFDFDNRPQCIYNMDETGVLLEPKPPKVIARKGQKKIRYRTSGQKAQITVIGCGNAVGNILFSFYYFCLDCGLFGPLKRHWQKSYHSFYQRNPTQVISKYNFCEVFREAWLNATSPTNVCSGFKKACIFPLNSDAVPVPSAPTKEMKQNVGSNKEEEGMQVAE